MAFNIRSFDDFIAITADSMDQNIPHPVAGLRGYQAGPHLAEITRHVQHPIRWRCDLRFFLIVVAVLSAAALSGCGEIEFPQVRLGSVPKPGIARLVYGLDSSGGPLQVALE